MLFEDEWGVMCGEAAVGVRVCACVYTLCNVFWIIYAWLGWWLSAAGVLKDVLKLTIVCLIQTFYSEEREVFLVKFILIRKEVLSLLRNTKLSCHKEKIIHWSSNKRKETFSRCICGCQPVELVIQSVLCPVDNICRPKKSFNVFIDFIFLITCRIWRFYRLHCI